ncbi:MAG: hypothetical protein HFJ47_04690 [Clostridia bacterium]|nr:hypothetical protein [Clostridia bacterium]
MDYYFYLNKLTEVEKNKQLLIFVLFWIIMFAIANILQSIVVRKYNDDINKRDCK